MKGLTKFDSVNGDSFFSEATVSFDAVVGACVVTCGEDLNCSVEEYTARGVNNFYFLEVIIFLRVCPLENLLVSDSSYEHLCFSSTRSRAHRMTRSQLPRNL